MEIHVDGYTVGANPSVGGGGGFTVVFPDDVPRKIQVTDKEGFTNNEGELRGLLFAAENAPWDGQAIIYTDSQVAIAWATNCKCKARPDLKPIAERIRHLVQKKGIKIRWSPREENLAGQFNDADK